VIGIRFRSDAGKKWSARGGREGLFAPISLRGDGTLFLCEGPTDCAALLGLGLEAVGRPSCAGGVALLSDVVRSRLPERVVIVADRDEAGRRGAACLAEALVPYARDIRLIEPPEGIKDVRVWVQARATRGDILRAAAKARLRKLPLQIRAEVKL